MSRRRKGHWQSKPKVENPKPETTWESGRNERTLWFVPNNPRELTPKEQLWDYALRSGKSRLASILFANQFLAVHGEDWAWALAHVESQPVDKQQDMDIERHGF